MLRKLAFLISVSLFYNFMFVGLASAHSGSKYLYAWTGDADKAKGDKDFMATIDVDAGSSTFGQVISTTPVNEVGTMPHHLEMSISPGNPLFASGFMADKIYLFDMKNPAQPVLVNTIRQVSGYTMSHSFARQPDSNMLATLQYDKKKSPASGGLALFAPDGSLIKTVGVGDAAFTAPIRSYAVAVAPKVDRFITTSTPMAMEQASSDVAQIYRLSDMKLLKTLALPIPKADPSRARHPFEIRVLADGRSAIINTYQCGFYLVDDIDKAEPKIELIYAMDKPKQRGCSVPTIVGNYWVMPVEKTDEIVVLDISNPHKTREVFVMPLDKGYSPHWVSREPGTNRIALTGFMSKDVRLMMLRINEKTGALSWDEKFRDPATGKLGVDFDRASWPHGDSGKAVPHGLVWSNP